MALTPPFQTPDEPVHFLRAYQISEFNFTVDRIPGGYGGKLPSSLGSTIDLTANHPSLSFWPNQKYNERKTVVALRQRLKPAKETSYDFTSTAGYSPIVYVPQSLSILLGRLLRMPPMVLLYLAKLANLTTWIVLGVLAIRLIPRKKWAVVFIALLPMAIFQSISLGADVMTIGLVMLFLAYILHLSAADKILSRKQLLLLLALAIAVVLTKQIMFVFLPLLFLIPLRLFSATKHRYSKLALLIGVPLIVYTGWSLVNHISTAGKMPNGAVPASQIHFILHNPWSFINVLWNTYFFTWGDTITRSFIGSFGWVDAPLAEWIVAAGYAAMGFVLAASYKAEQVRQWFSRGQKLLILTVGVLYWLATSAALYVYYSPVGFKIIVGLQGRYFLPVLPLAVLLLYGKQVVVTERLYKKIAVYAPIFLLTASAITIYVRYYINNV